MNCFKKLSMRNAPCAVDVHELEILNPPVGQVGNNARDVWRAEMFNAIKQVNATRKECADALVIFDTQSRDIKDLFDPESEDPHYTILQYACSLGNEMVAAFTVNRIFQTALSFSYNEDDIYKFVNYCVGEGRTALQIALSNGYRDVVIQLLENAADVNAREPGKCEHAIYDIYRKFPDIMINYFDKGIQIRKDQNDTLVRFDFSTVTGIYRTGMEPDYNQFHETGLLAISIGLNESERSEILLHPLAQIFLHRKGSWKRLEIFVFLSIIYQILWAYLSIKFLVNNMYNIPVSNSSTANASDSTDPTETQIPCNLGHPGFNCSFYVCFVVSIVTEILELTISTTKHLYRSLLINQCQACIVTAHIVVFICYFLEWIIFKLTNDPMKAAWPSYLATPVHICGILAAFLLVQTQSTKMGALGLYNLMLFQIFTRSLKFFATFSPILLLFTLTFIDLLNQRPFELDGDLNISKIFAMLTGELNYNDIFYPNDKNDYPPAHPFLTKLVLLIFIIAVVILLSNLLTALAVQDVQKLKEKYTTGYLTIRLEIICLVEQFVTSKPILWILGVFGMKNIVLRRILLGPASTQSYGCSHVYETKISTLPNSLREKIIKKCFSVISPGQMTDEQQQNLSSLEIRPCYLFTAENPVNL